MAWNAWKSMGRIAARTTRWLGLDERRCRACGHVMTVGDKAQGLALCSGCRLELEPRRGGFCTSCGALFADQEAAPGLCGQCLGQARPWRRVLVGRAYAGTLRRMILDYKFAGRLALGAALQHAALETWRVRRDVFPGDLGPNADRGAPEVVVPIPLHPKRLKKRGFNQSQEIARPLAKLLNLDLDSGALQRIRYTQPQMSLAGSRRAGNVRGAFLADPQRVGGKVVLLVDDITTTGATVAEAGRALMAAGAKAVDALVLARTLEPGFSS